MLPGHPEPRQNVPCVRFKNRIESVNVSRASYVPFLPERCEIRTKQWLWLSSRHPDVSGISALSSRPRRVALWKMAWVGEFSTIYGRPSSCSDERLGWTGVGTAGGGAFFNCSTSA
jgi:hypothetical protein